MLVPVDTKKYSRDFSDQTEILECRRRPRTHFDRYYDQSGENANGVVRNVLESANWSILAYTVPLVDNANAVVVGAFRTVRKTTLQDNGSVTIDSHLEPRAVLEIFSSADAFWDVFPWESAGVCLSPNTIFTEAQIAATLLGHYEVAGESVSLGAEEELAELERVYPGITKRRVRLQVCKECFEQKGRLQCAH